MIVNSFSWWFIGVAPGPEYGTVSPKGQRDGGSPRMRELVFVGDRCKTKKDEGEETKTRKSESESERGPYGLGWDGCA